MSDASSVANQCRGRAKCQLVFTPRTLKDAEGHTSNHIGHSRTNFNKYQITSKKTSVPSHNNRIESQPKCNNLSIIQKHTDILNV